MRPLGWSREKGTVVWGLEGGLVALRGYPAPGRLVCARRYAPWESDTAGKRITCRILSAWHLSSFMQRKGFCTASRRLRVPENPHSRCVGD